MLIIIPVLAALIGCLVYALSNNPKVAELGRITYHAGLLVSLWVFCNSGLVLHK